MSVWDEARDKLDIQEVLSKYLDLSPSGVNLKARCPFHNDRTPSLIVSPQKQIWHCFGCGAGGNAFSFVSQIENITSYEALQKLAGEYNLNLNLNKQEPDPDQTIKQKESASRFSVYQQGLNLLAWAADLYHKRLWKSLDSNDTLLADYLKNRGIDKELINTFRLGYAPKGDSLVALTKQKPTLSFDWLQNVGLIVKRETETGLVWKDKFRNRLIIPIRNKTGNVVGFTARVWDKNDSRPKYLNSPETKWFLKSQLLFNLDLARKYIYQEQAVILVEGHMDVIIAWKHGLRNIVASGGTSVTTQQIQTLAKLSKRLVIATDQDEAGQLAATKIFKLASKHNLQIDRLVWPTQFKDLDECLTKNAIYRQIPFMQAWLNRHELALKSENKTQQVGIIKQALELLAKMDTIAQKQYINKISASSGLSKNILLDELNKQNTSSGFNNF